MEAAIEPKAGLGAAGLGLGDVHSGGASGATAVRVDAGGRGWWVHCFCELEVFVCSWWLVGRKGVK